MMNTIHGQKYIWHLPAASSKAVLDIAQRYSVSFPVAHTLVTRGFESADAAEHFLFSSFEQDVASSALLKDALKAVERIAYAIKKKQKILIFGDYDVDGITSSALMLLCLKPLDADINFFLPNRVRDGYGLSTQIVERAAANGYKVIITVDNGITAFEPAAKARQLDIDLIITDHHKPHAQLPEAYAIVNPNQAECTYPFKFLAGVGVTFKVLSLLYEQLKLPMPAKAYELLLLGTIADVVPLIGENRYWVRHGLQKVNAQESIAMKILKQNNNMVKDLLSATDIGFSIAPQINALGRLEDPRQAVQFLIGADYAQTEQVGKVLFELNQARKEIERAIFHQVVSEIEKSHIDLSQEKIILAASDQWPSGVIGLVASRLVGAYARPALLFHLNQGKAKGSCRSIKAFNIFDALHEARHFLDTFGGHAAAAGLALDVEKLPQLKEHLEELACKQLTPLDLQQKIVFDAPLPLTDVTKKLIHDLALMEPFGHENPTPLFYIKNVSLVQKAQLLKDAHVKCSIFAEGIIKPVIFFNRPELFDWFNTHHNESFSLAAQVTENYWQGKTTIELLGIDVAQEQ